MRTRDPKGFRLIFPKGPPFEVTRRNRRGIGFQEKYNPSSRQSAAQSGGKCCGNDVPGLKEMKSTLGQPGSSQRTPDVVRIPSNSAPKTSNRFSTRAVSSEIFFGKPGGLFLLKEMKSTLGQPGSSQRTPDVVRFLCKLY